MASESVQSGGAVGGAVAGVIVAAGLSERMERPKQLLPFGDTTLLGWVLREAEASQLDRIAVAVGHRADEVEASLSPDRATIVHNPDYRQGNLTSLLVGIEAVRGADGVMVLLGDMPEVSRHVINRVLTAWRVDQRRAAVAEYAADRGHPVLLSSAAIRDLGAYGPGRAVWRLVDAASDLEVLRVPAGLDQPLDVNTAHDYIAVGQRLGVEIEEI